MKFYTGQPLLEKKKKYWIRLHWPEILSGVRCPVRFTLIHNRRDSGAKRTVTYVRMADHPAHVGRCPPNVVSGHAIYAAHRPTQRRDVAAGGPDDSLWFVWKFVLHTIQLVRVEILSSGREHRDTKRLCEQQKKFLSAGPTSKGRFFKTLVNCRF